MLAGFGFSSLKMDFPSDTSALMQILYLSFTAAAIGFSLCAIINASTCSVFGPGKFLRGRDGLKSANDAVKVMDEKSETTITYFFGGFTCIILSSIMKSFLLHTFYNALTVSVALFFMAIYLMKVGRRIKTQLYVTHTKAITGEIEEERDVNASSPNARFPLHLSFISSILKTSSVTYL